jgi:hypothetical protein
MLKLVANMARELLAAKERCEVSREAKIDLHRHKGS